MVGRPAGRGTFEYTIGPDGVAVSMPFCFFDEWADLVFVEPFDAFAGFVA